MNSTFLIFQLYNTRSRSISYNDLAETTSLEMEQSLVDAVLQLQQPFGIEEGHGPEQMDDGRSKVDHNRKTRQRDHRCHCGKNFQVR